MTATTRSQKALTPEETSIAAGRKSRSFCPAAPFEGPSQTSPPPPRQTSWVSGGGPTGETSPHFLSVLDPAASAQIAREIRSPGQRAPCNPLQRLGAAPLQELFQFHSAAQECGCALITPASVSLRVQPERSDVLRLPDEKADAGALFSAKQKAASAKALKQRPVSPHRNSTAQAESEATLESRG